MASKITDRRRQLRFSTAMKEANFGEAAARDTLINFERSATTRPDHQIENDLENLGPTLEPNDQEMVAKARMMDVETSFCDLHTALFIIAYGLGKVTTVDGNDSCTGTPPGADAYKHTIVMSDEIDLPTFSYSEIIPHPTAADTEKFLCTGAGITNFSLQAQMGGDRRVRLFAGILAKSRTLDATLADTATKKALSEGGDRLNGGWSRIYKGTGVDATISDVILPPKGEGFDLTGDDTNLEISSNVRSINWELNNASDKNELYYMGSGDEISAMERGDPSQTITLTMNYENKAILDEFEDQDEIALEWGLSRGTKVHAADKDTTTLTSLMANYHFGMKVIWPRLKIASYTPGRQGAKRTIDVALTPLPESVQNSVKVVAINKVAGYAGS